ncbi:MAG: gliding motility-associated C-terminal domain-containing protein [Phaeodactylibacter sp.]|nr:gliding motility-associated C-terminal domain-containing protein [Phaeodactylibacter sp.]MCB9266915.1 gliding motility-associated C-terminal domain-containing protein [Lewinellaceae bacterium]MCB9285739.1 gliding motility-associated C-terminal domain-containing protein [Lewinellaceae bacterium]
MKYRFSLALFFLGSALTLKAQTTVGLVAYYTLDSIYRDVTGNTANTGTPAGNPYFTCGAAGQALVLDGQDDEVVILSGPVNDEFDDEDLTVSLYIKPTGGDGTQYVLSKRSPSCFGGNEFYIRYVPTTRTVNAVFLETADKSVFLSHQLTNTACWQHVAVVREGGRARLYINGERVQLLTTANRLDVFNDGDLTIGNGDCKTATERPFKGLIDEIRVYNRALDDREIRDLYFAPDQIRKASAVVSVFLGESLDIQLTNTCADNFTWSPAQGVSDPFAPEPVITPIEKGEVLYTVAMADTISTCIATDSILIDVIDPNDLDCNAIFLPNAFTPNDDGLNDTYGISNPYSVQELLSFDIIDRWGNTVFSTTDPFERWDGSYRGQAVNSGVMRYQLNFICEGEEKVLTGTVSILR